MNESYRLKGQKITSMYIPSSWIFVLLPYDNPSSTCICIFLAQIPLFINKINEAKLWPHPSISVDLKEWSSVIQWGLQSWLDTATSRFKRLGMSSHMDKKKTCRSWLSTGNSNGAIVSHSNLRQLIVVDWLWHHSSRALHLHQAKALVYTSALTGKTQNWTSTAAVAV